MTALTVYLAPGASGGMRSIEPYLRGMRGLGYPTEAVTLPKGTAERAVATYRTAVTAEPAIIGGQSFGGRVASMLVAEDGDVAAGLVLICYPLHAPGRSERWRERTEHWHRVGCPVLLLSGDHDPFARIDLLREAVTQLPNAELHVYSGVGHGLGAVAQDALERIAGFARSLAGPIHSR
ncbi:MAG TPA: alpha/beta family hydrolase [Candidatus Limnocylindria bacterium]|nr:alpha/beta family hydrolase [Candidatus Limnocylindria bacterium]